MVKTPWFCMSTAGDREPVSVSTMPWPIESSPISANGPTGIGAAELVGHRGQHARDLLARAPPTPRRTVLCVCTWPPTSGMFR